MNLNALIYLLVNYFGSEKHIKSLVVVNCFDKMENFKLLKELSLNKMSVLSLSSNDMNGTQWPEQLIDFSSKTHSLGIYLDYSCVSSEDFIESCEGCFTTRFKWLIQDFNESNNESSIFNQLSTFNLFVDAEIMCLTLQSSKGSIDTYAMYDVFNNAYRFGGELNTTLDRYFIIENETQLYFTDSILNQRSKYSNRISMKDTTLRLGYVLPKHERFERDEDLIRYLLSDNNTSVDTISRYSVNVGMIIKDALMFNVTHVRFSRWASNDSYGELIEAIDTDKVDLGLAFILLFTERIKYFSPITQITEFRSRFYFLTSVQVDSYGKHFLMPFVKSVWVCIAVTMILVSSVLSLIQSYDKFRDGSTFIHIFGVFCQQGAASIPSLVSGRCLYIFLLLSAYCVYSYYTSILVSTLVKSGSKNEINSLADLGKSQLKIGFEDIPYMRSFLNSTQDPEYRTFISQKVNLKDNSQFISNNDGLERVRKQHYAFHCEANTAFPMISRTFSPRQICDLNVLQFRHEKDQALVIRIGSPFRDIFAVKVFWMRETGIVSKHQRHWMAQKPPCLTNALFTRIDFASTVALVELLVIGYLLSILILLFEMAHHQKILHPVYNLLRRPTFDALKTLTNHT